MEYETFVGMAASSTATGCRSAIRPFHGRPLSSWYKASSMAARQGSQRLHHNPGQARKLFRPGLAGQESEPDPHRDDDIEENDCSAHHEDGNGVANTPKCSDQHRPQTVTLIADNGCDRNDSSGSVAWRIPRENPTARMERKLIMYLYLDCLDCRCLAQARRKKSQILFHALPGLS